MNKKRNSKIKLPIQNPDLQGTTASRQDNQQLSDLSVVGTMKKAQIFSKDSQQNLERQEKGNQKVQFQLDQTQKRVIKGGVEIGDDYQDYLNQNPQIGKRNQLQKLGSSVLDSKSGIKDVKILMEDLRQDDRNNDKKQNLNRSVVTNYSNLAGPTKISTGLEYRTPSIVGITNIGRYSSANVSPVGSQRNQLQLQQLQQVNPQQKRNQFEFGIIKQSDLPSESLDQVMEVQTLAQEYGLDNYSVTNKRASDNSSAGGGTNQFGSFPGSLLKNEILRNTEINNNLSMINQQQYELAERGSKQLDNLTRKQKQQSLVKQIQEFKSNASSTQSRIKQQSYRKDGKDIGDLLNYKDYALSNLPKKPLGPAHTKLAQLLQLTQEEDLNKTIAQKLKMEQSQIDPKLLEEYNKEHRILKNTYHPSFQSKDNQIRPKSLIKIPDALLNAFSNRLKEQNQASSSDPNFKSSPNKGSSFHITDLLDYDNKKKKLDRLNYSFQQEAPEVIDPKQQNEFVIKNYRLIQKKKREFFLPTTAQHSPARNHMLQSSTAPQSPIRVSNSILSPNTYHFSTKVQPANQLQWNNIANMHKHNQSENLGIKTNEVSIINEENPSQINFQIQPLTQNQYLKIPQAEHTIQIETQEFDLENRPNIVEENYKDVIASWVGQRSEKDLNKKFNRNEFADLLQREYSVSKIFNQQSSDSLDVENTMIMKLKPQHQMYKDQLMSSSIDQKSKNNNMNTLDSKLVKGTQSTTGIHEDPYGHLKARNVFEEKATQFQKQIELTMHNPDTRTKVKMIIELSKDFLTHLDKSILSADRLPLELFDDFITENEIIKKRIDDRKRRNKSPLKAKSYYFHLDGTREEADARVLEYDPEKKKFLIEFKSGDKILQKHAGRLNLHFVDFETRHQIEERRNQAKNLRKEAAIKLNIERLFIYELSKRYDYIRLPQKFKQNIKKKLVIDLQKYDPEKVKLLVIQVEALFVFSILKSVIYSQIGDPFITRIVAQYKIEETDESKQALPYYALKSYEENGGKLEKMLNKDEARLILQDYAIVGKKSFIDAIQFLISQNEEIVIKTPIFEFPIQPNLIMYILTQEEFKDKQVEPMKIKLKNFPTSMPTFVKSQRILARRFKETLEVRWTENIAKKIERIVDKEFDLNSRDIQRKSLNPYVLKLFELIRLYQEKNLYDKLYSTLENYIKFLLQFAIRDSAFTQSGAFRDFEFGFFKVLMSANAMINVKVKIKKIKQQLPEKALETDKTKSSKKQVIFNDQKGDSPAIKSQFEIQTKPLLSDVWQDFHGMVDMFINSVSRIRRIDEIVIPQLKLKKSTLRNPDKEKDKKLQHFIAMVSVIIDNMKVKPEKRVLKLQKYLQYLQINFDGLILDMKRRSYDEANSISEEDSHDEHGKQEDAAFDNKFLSEAYKNIEISELVYIDRFNELRGTFWDVQLSVDSIYDFGIVAIDCNQFKQLVKKHIDKLIIGLSKYVVTEFLNKMNNLFTQFESIEKKAVENVQTIDEVIHLIDYIDKIQKPDDLLDELENYLDVIKTRKDFIDTLQLRLLDVDFEKYLKLFSYPSRLRTMLSQRKQALENERNRLSEQMKKERQKILQQINSFRENLDSFKDVGLQKPAVPYVNNLENAIKEQVERKIIRQKSKQNVFTSSINQSSSVVTMAGIQPSNTMALINAAQTPSTQDITAVQSNAQSSENTTRKSVITSKQDKQPDGAFNPTFILEMADKMEKLKSDLEGAEQDCDIINRREKLLNMQVTKFGNQITPLQNEIKPFVQMWSIAASYTRVYEKEMINEWWKQLTRVSKTHISQYPEPMTLLSHLQKELEKFKDYMPMITALRSKGLEKRHWQMLSKQLGFEIDPNNLTLQKLISKQLYEGQKLDIIKGISEIAIKEYAIKTTLDALEHELRIMEFQPMKYKDTNTFIIKGLDDLITAFEESSIKILALKSNSYAKHFMDKIIRVEKELKIIVDVLDEWVKAQKSWVYLEPIFQQQDIAKQMINESQKFFSLDSFYKREISNINIDPGVQRYCRKEGLITQLQYVNKEFENITRGLSFYLEAKREYFARFYFLSNEEIIEILGQMREPRNVQRFLNKIFEGIDYLGFMSNGEIVGIYSKEDEYIQLRKPIEATESAENWLKTLEYEMRESVKQVIQQSVVDVRMKDFESWVKSWQGQIVIVVMNIILTETLTDIFTNEQTYRLKDILKQIVYEIEALTKMIRTKLDYNTRTTICSLLTNRVHARDTIKNMIDSDVRYSSDFLWKLFMKYEYQIVPKTKINQEILSPSTPKGDQQSEVGDHKNQSIELAKRSSQLKSQSSMVSEKSNHSKKSKDGLRQDSQQVDLKAGMKRLSSKAVDKEQELVQFKQQESYSLNVSMIDAKRPYGYEYLGNTQRIVITPLTDRCYRSLFMALHFNYGGSPEGPVGTGKTETTKDLSKCLAKQCFVFNCSSSLNYVAMTKFFKGLATSGAWSCFDEFNRIDLQVLSVISQIIIIIQGAIRENRSELNFEDTPIQFSKDCAIFITMNPQYIGRTELPDNLKSLFRPVSMIVPDSILISEILLYSFGFLQAKPLARKMVRAFNLAKQQLSNQIHYDFGLRSIKIVLQIAGLMKLKAAGVIEADFKIKEGKLKKKKDSIDTDNSIQKKESSLNFQDSAEKINKNRRRSKYQPAKNRKKSSANVIKRLTIVKKRTIDESLDSLDAVQNKRTLSLTSKDFDDQDNGKFFEKIEVRNKNDDDDFEEDFKLSIEKTDGSINQFHKYKVMYSRVMKSAQKFSTERRKFIRGNAEKIMNKRLEFIAEHKDEAKLTRKLMKVLGIEEEDLVDDEERIEEFIVLRAINDTNVPKLHQTDTIIFRGIMDDIFPQSIKTTVKQGSLTTLVEEVIQGKGLQQTEDIIQRVQHLYESVMIRHGVMIVGSTLTGKTTSVQLLQESLNKSRDNEIEEKIQQYKLKKAKRLGLTNQDSSIDENDLLQQTQVDLTSEEVKMVKASCRNKGVVTYTINPKSVNLGQLMGTYDEISHDWNDGIMANVMRNCSLDISERRKWIVFDGPIDPVWVENLNSVMDDNKKLTLSTGETIKMTGLMTIIIEAEDLSNCTPATISRCGMIYMKDEIIPLKALLNKWIKSLPTFLEDVASDIDQMCNYFIPEILENFIHQNNLIYPVSQKWAIKTFCRMMNSMINDYRSDKFNSNNSAAYTIYSENQNEEATNQMSTKLSTIMGKRPYHVQYCDVDSRFQNALRNKTMWVQCFFLFCLVWAFGSILKISMRKEFDRQLRAKILCNTDEISTIAQLKQKIVKKQVGIVTPGGATNKNQQLSSYQPTATFKDPEKPPYFLCGILQTYSLFEVYFDLETNSWQPWESLKQNYKNYDEDDATTTSKSFKKKGSIFNKFIPTLETIRLGYIIESNIICKNNLLLIGPTGCGKSWLSREMLFKQLPNVSQKYKCSTMVFSNNITADKTQHFIDSRLERRRKGVFGPPFSHKYVFFIDDLMMPFKDDYGIQSANELLRQWFDFQGWYDHRTLDFKKIEDIQFLACVTVYEAHKNSISTRSEWHWSYLGTINMDEKHYNQLFSQIIDSFSVNWPHAIQGAPITNVIKATLDLYAYFERHVKPTPTKFLYLYNTRHMFKIIYGMSEVEPNYLKSEYELAKLWIHESWRTLCDRISDYSDKKILFGKFNELARKYFKIEKKKLSKKIGYPFFCPFNKGHDGMYTEVEDMKETTLHLRKYLQEYNEIHKKQRINVVLFDFLVEFMIKVHRIIKQPFSHGILIGIEGSGKSSLAQMACFLANYQLYEIKLEANYTLDDWYNDLKTMLQTAGVDQKEVVFHLKHNEIIKECFLDDLNTLVNNGEIQGIFTKEEYENIISQMSNRVINDKNSAANNQLILAEFTQKCRENFKLLLNFTPTGANLRSRIRNYKAIVNCSTIIWMEQWPQEGYKEVAEVLLKEDEVVNRDLILEIAINMHMDTIAMAKQYFYETQHYLYLTPHSFADFIQTYKDLFEQKRSNLKDLQERYEIGLERLKNTQDQVEKYQQQLENNSPMLIEKQIEIEKILEQLKEEHMKIGKRRDILMKEEEELKIQSEQADKIKEECEINLQKATPELFSAIAALQNLSKNEINELKTLKNAPKAVKLLLQGVCLLLRVEPIKFKGKDGVGFIQDYWAAATSKHVLGNPKLQEALTTFDHNSLDSEVMSNLEELTSNPEFIFENIARASKAAKGLFLWIQAIKNYYYIYQETQPKRDALFFAEKQKIEKEELIKIKLHELSSLEDNLNILKKEHTIKEQEIRVLQKQIDECSLKKERATKLLNGLGGEKQKWLVCNRMIAKKFLTIQGDVLLGAAYITYLSAFTQKYREKTVEKWENMIKNFGIRITDDFNFNKIFGDQIKVKEWNFNGLPSDSFSISNAIILENSQKQCICIDPQYQANKWIKLQEKDLKILNFSDVNFNQSFELAIKFGKKVLIENVGQKIDLVLYPILKKEFVTESGTNSVNLFGHMVEMDKNFKLFITSEIKAPHFGPDIAVMTNFVNFYVTLEGLEEQMLSIVISNQKQELEEETIKMKKEALDYIKILKKLEDDILSSLHNDIEQILSDEHLIETLSFSKRTGRQIAENLQKVNKASTKLLKSRGIYTPAAYRASLLYFLVSDLSKIEVVYQFSLKWYIEIFTEEVKSKKHTDQDPLLDIIRNFTYTLYRKVCQSIFEKDKLMFTFLLAFRILEGENCLNMKLFEFFIKGPQIKGYEQSDALNKEDTFTSSSESNSQNDEEEDEKNEEQKQRKIRCPWISEQQWLALEKLSKIPPFHRPNLCEHILQYSEQWQQYIFAKETDPVQMPGPYTEWDPEKEARIASKKKARKGMQNKDSDLKEIKEVQDEDNEDAKIDERIWGLDEEDDDDKNKDDDSNLSDEDEMKEKFIDDREQIADSLVLGVSEYNEFRLGSVRFEKEMITKKLQVLKDLMRFCIIRIFRAERVVREIQRFLGSVLDPRFMEPPVFNLQSLYKETSCYSPILFILSPTINTLNELQILKYQIGTENAKIEYMPLGSNINEKVQQLILKSAIQGNWLLLENLHLVTDWIPTLEKFIHTMYKEDRRDVERQNQQEAESELDTNRGETEQINHEQTNNINMFPELKGCRISTKFRLWLSSMPVDYFPVSFLQECMKITLQPAQGIRQNALKILNSISYDFLQRCPKRQADFRKLFFALCIFHSVVVERQRFGPIGWSQPYHFSENDFLISSLQLQSEISKIKTKEKPLPLDLLRYLIGTLNYGGRVIKNQDEVTLKALLETFIGERTVIGQNYRLTGVDSKDMGIYYVPGDGDLQHYKMHIMKFPIQDRPEIFGLHENATIMRSTNEGKNLLARMFEFEFASKEMVKASAMLEANDDANMQKYSTIKKRIQMIIEDLPELLDEELCASKYPISYDSCINTLITKEVQRFNMLLQVIYVSLKNTLKALEGVIHINSVLEDIYKTLTLEYVPRTWYKYSYPCFKSLPLFLMNLKERVNFIRSWLSDKHPYNFWLPGFFDQQSFFTMILQQKARNEKISIELLSIEFTILKKNFGVKGMPTQAPADGCYIYGLWLEGANWSDDEQRLLDCDGRNLYQELPCMHLKVINHLEFEKKYQNDEYYQCPLYFIGLRDRLESEFQQGLVTTVPLPIGQKSKPAFWIKRGTSILCQKEE